MEGFRPYSAKFAEVLGSLAEKAGEETNPLLEVREEVEKIHIVLCTSDRGLCGGFNAHLISKAKAFKKEKEAQGIEVVFTNFGKKGRDWCRKNKIERIDEYLGVVGARFGFNVASSAGQKLINGFLDKTYDEVYVVYAEFVSMARQTPILKQVLPILPIASAEQEIERKKTHRISQNIFVSLHPRNCWANCCQRMFMFSCTAHCSKHPPASTPHGWLRWTMPPKPVKI